MDTVSNPCPAARPQLGIVAAKGISGFDYHDQRRLSLAAHELGDVRTRDFEDASRLVLSHGLQTSLDRHVANVASCYFERQAWTSAELSVSHGGDGCYKLPMDLGQQLKARREALGLKQADVAARVTKARLAVDPNARALAAAQVEPMLEDEANMFAAHLLVPDAALSRMALSIEAIVQRFCVSPRTAERRLDEWRRGREKK